MYVSGDGEVLDDAGHHVLLMSDTDSDDLAHTALPTADLARTLLRDTGLRRLLLLFDTCYSGQGSNELAATALERIGAEWGRSTGGGFVIVSSAQPREHAGAGVFPRLLSRAVASRATAGDSPRTLSVSTVVQQMNDSPERPDFQRVFPSLVGLTGEPPAFLPNPRYSTVQEVDLSIQRAAEFHEQDRRRDVELTRRLLVHAMGHHGPGAGRWWFSVRHAALADLTRWLQAEPAPGVADACRVLTADPGSGKTAVLGLTAALAHPEHRRTVPLHSLGLDPHRVPGERSVDVSVYAQSLTDSQVVQGLAAEARVSARTVGELLAALPEPGDGETFTAIVDALDEAATPHTLCTQVLRPLIEHSRGRIRLLLGTRPYLLPLLGTSRDAAGVIDLDAARYADPKAVATYAARNLLEAHPDSPYLENPGAVRPVAEAVAAAGSSFLVARITAGFLASAPDVVEDPTDPVWRAGLPRHATEALDRDLRRRLSSDAARVVDLLRSLAHAQGQGSHGRTSGHHWPPRSPAVPTPTRT
ncbi:hypothetical protein [Streptomyces sp. NPDC058486]|uniref:hypothetical protein n=1 Tax=unclassified Streptomyces TaxID=2593676 RepID=UPI00364CF107